MLISGITQKYGENELVNYLYDYNDNSDVSAVYENGIKVARYVYGDMNKQCKYAHTCSKCLLVTIPQTPEILNFVEGLRVQRTLKKHDGRLFYRRVFSRSRSVACSEIFKRCSTLDFTLYSSFISSRACL